MEKVSEVSIFSKVKKFEFEMLNCKAATPNGFTLHFRGFGSTRCSILIVSSSSQGWSHLPSLIPHPTRQTNVKKGACVYVKPLIKLILAWERCSKGQGQSSSLAIDLFRPILLSHAPILAGQLASWGYQGLCLWSVLPGYLQASVGLSHFLTLILS